MNAPGSAPIKFLRLDLPVLFDKLDRFVIVIIFHFLNGLAYKSVIKFALKSGLHYGDYRSQLVHLESQKIFSIFKNA